MIDGPTLGVYKSIPHVVAWIWSQDSFLNNLVPVSDDEERNAFYMFGLDHITDDRLLNMSTPYAVLQDLGEANLLSGAARVGVWPHRLSVYAHATDDVTFAMTRMLALLATNGAVATDLGGVCSLTWTSRRIYQSQNHHVCTVILQPKVVG